MSELNEKAPAKAAVSGEPVAWLRVRDDGRQTFWERDVDGACTPLYTHPAPKRDEAREAGNPAICKEAAATIERLTRELATARTCEDCMADAQTLIARAEAAEAELAKAREALEEIAETDVIYPPHDPGNYFAPEGREGPCAKIARAALAPSPAPKDKSQSE